MLKSLSRDNSVFSYFHCNSEPRSKSLGIYFFILAYSPRPLFIFIHPSLNATHFRMLLRSIYHQVLCTGSISHPSLMHTYISLCVTPIEDFNSSLTLLVSILLLLLFFIQYLTLCPLASFLNLLSSSHLFPVVISSSSSLITTY